MTSTPIYIIWGRFNRLSVSAIGQFRYNHHPVTDDYYLDEANGKIVKTYSNGGNAQYYSAILALQYKLCKFANLWEISDITMRR